MARHRLHYWIGLNGVDPHENALALSWARYLEFPAITIALGVLVVWYTEARGISQPAYSRTVDYGVWLFFIGETTLLSVLVNDPWRYLRHNWLNLVIIVLGVPVLWGFAPYATGLRSLRLLIFLSLLLPLSDTLRKILARNHLGAMLALSALVVFIAGYLMAGIDPNITTPDEGIWWAWVTVSGVGYGDVIPSSLEGRILAVFLILFGVALYSIVTANLAVYFISQADSVRHDQLTHKNSRHLDERLLGVEKELAAIRQQLEKLDSRLAESLENSTPPENPAEAEQKPPEPKPPGMG